MMGGGHLLKKITQMFCNSTLYSAYTYHKNMSTLQWFQMNSKAFQYVALMFR